MLRAPIRLTLAALAPLLLLSLSQSETPERYPVNPAAGKNELLLTGGLDLLTPSIGIRYREKSRYEYVARLGLLRDIQAVDLGVNFFADNSEPEKRGTWYFGPSLFYYHEDDNIGIFHLAYLNATAGREKRLSERWRFNWEVGLGVMVYETVQTAGAPFLFPVIPALRAEFLYRVI